MNLVKAELSRFFSRRFIQVMILVLMGAFAITVMTVMAESQAPSPGMWEQAQLQAQDERERRVEQFAFCLEVQADSPNSGAQDCARFDPDRVQPEDYLWSVFNFSHRIDELVKVLGLLLACFGFLVTASFVGSELHSGGMTNLLLWRPNRLAVLGAKLGVAVGAVTAISAVVTALYVGTFYGIAETTGWVGDTYPPFWSDLFWLSTRVLGLAIALSVIAFGIAVLGRHTAAALGSLIAYVVIWEIGARIVVSALNRYAYSPDDWFLSYHLYNWLEGPRSGIACLACLGGRVTWNDSAATITVITVLIAAAAFVTFRRRDLA